jgi:phospholipid/cholesterol/gamma-HCH transport system substrate-binding protein
VRLLPKRNRRPVRRSPYDENLPDERVWGRSYAGPHPWFWGIVVALLIAIGVYLAFAKQLPWSGPGYTVKATFENAATLRPSSPVRIAGVNVGEVTEVESAGDATEVTFSVSDEGRPIHADAEVELRPRLFLEGNFFLDLSPGSPSAEELPEDGTIPVTQTATAVQLDEVLTALQAPQRRGLQRLLSGFGTALNYQPTAADDADQTLDVRGETAAESLNDAFRYGGPAGRNTAIVSDALRGEQPHDLSLLIRAGAATFGKLASVEGDLAELVTNFNVTAGALAAESENLSETISLLGPTLDQTNVSLRHLSDALPPLRALAIESRPGIQELPATIDALEPWLAQTGELVSDRELGTLARLLKNAAPGLAETAAGSKELFPQANRLSRCSTENLIPTADAPITADSPPFTTAQPNFQEFFYGAVQIAGAGQPFDGNGPYLRLQPAGGDDLVHNTNPTTFPNDNLNFGTAVEPPQGVQPVAPPQPPPFRTDVACHEQDPPNLNGPAGAAGPPDLTP